MAEDLVETICGHCGFPFDAGEPLRHFGFFNAHLESRCLWLLRNRIRELEAVVEEISSRGVASGAD